MDYTPRPEHKFTFGLWTVGNVGRDPFGEPVRATKSPVELVHLLADVGAYGVNFHDNDLVPIDATPDERNQIVRDFKKALNDTGLVVPMATTNLFTDPVFRDGAFTSNDASVRAYAVQKTMRAIDLGVECGAKVYVFWGGREGTETDATKNPAEAVKRFREAINFLTHYVKSQGYDLQFALEPKPNEPRGDIFLSTVGHALAFISTLDHAEMVGVNPEVAHETMAGLSFYQGVAQALWQGKLFHIDLNDQKIGRYDQDLRFGSEGIKDNFFLVRLLENSGYAGPKHFDSRPYRNEGGEGIWDFARGSMRTYLILKEKAKEFDANPRVKQAFADAGVPELAQPTVGPYSTGAADQLLSEKFDPETLASRGYRNEQLDQLVIDTILGA